MANLMNQLMGAQNRVQRRPVNALRNAFQNAQQGQANQQFVENHSPAHLLAQQLMNTLHNGNNGLHLGQLQGAHPPHAGGNGAPPPPPAPRMHNGTPMSPLRAVFQDLRSGLDPMQMQHLLAGHVPGGEHGDFAALNHRPAVMNLIAQLMQQGGQGLPGTYNAFAHYINNGLAHPGPNNIFKVRPPQAPNPITVGNSML